MTSQELIEVCSDIGLRVEPAGLRLLVVDTQHDQPYIPHGLFLLLVERRDEIRDRLRVGHLAKQILLGEFDSCGVSTHQKLTTDLRSVPHPLVQRALERMEARR